jgi:carbamoyltransferase
MIILGINAYHGDAAAAIVRDGELIGAAEEERFNRRKHCAGFPTQAIQYCLQAAGINIQQVDHVGISRDPSAHLHKKILFAATRAVRQTAVGSRQAAESQAAVGTRQVAESSSRMAEAEKSGNGAGNGNGRASGIFGQIKDRLANAGKVRNLKSELARLLGVPDNDIRAQFHNVEHHRAHLASSFFVSPFEKAALLSIDGFGDFISTMWGVGEGNSIEVMDQVEFPHSTGIVYTATTQFIGFPHYGDEGKVMGLAPYGRPTFIETFRDIIRTEADGRFKLNLDYFRHHSEGVEMSWDEGSPVIGRIFSDQFATSFGPARNAGEELTQRERDIAASCNYRLDVGAFHRFGTMGIGRLDCSDLGLAGGVRIKLG